MAAGSRVKIGIINDSINMLDHFVALDAGIYQDERLEVELVIQRTRRSLESLLSGDVLVNSSTHVVTESLLLDRAPYKIVLITRRNPPHYVIARPEIKSSAALRGKTICGAGPGSTNFYMMLDWLERNGLKLGADVFVKSYDEPQESFFDGPTPEWVKPAVKLTADAMMVVPPEWEWMTQQAGYNTLVELSEEYPDRMIHGLAAPEETLKKKPELIRAAVRAHIRAAKTIREDPETTIACVMKRWRLNRRVAEGVWKNMRHRFISEIDPSLLKAEIEYFRDHLKRRFPDQRIDAPDPANIVDPSFI